MSKPVAIIFGAGQKVGASTAKMLRGKCYRVASVARSPSQAADKESLSLSYDLSNPTNVTNIFNKVRESWGEPSVIVYNAAAVHPTSASDPFAVELSVESFEQDLAVNTTSAFVALKEAMASFATLPKSAARTFLYTGNCLNEAPLATLGVLTLGAGKSATAHMIAFADKAYAAKGWRFYYVDERTSDGVPMTSGVNGPAHAGSLIDGNADAPAIATFADGEGFKAFPRLT